MAAPLCFGIGVEAVDFLGEVAILESGMRKVL